MVERGVVSEVKGDTLIVKTKRRAACNTCEACHEGESREMVLELENSIGAKAGDEVNIELDDSLVLKGAFFFYGLPLSGLLAGLFTGMLAARRMETGVTPEAAGALSGITLMMIVFIVSARYNLRRRDTYRPRITRP